MTKAEIQTVRKAITLLMDEDGAGFMDAIESLCHLVGCTYPAAEAMRNATPTTVQKLFAYHKYGDRKFDAKEAPDAPENS